MVMREGTSEMSEVQMLGVGGVPVTERGTFPREKGWKEGRGWWPMGLVDRRLGTPPGRAQPSPLG